MPPMSGHYSAFESAVKSGVVGDASFLRFSRYAAIAKYVMASVFLLEVK